jgi:hypothetical protein
MNQQVFETEFVLVVNKLADFAHIFFMHELIRAYLNRGRERMAKAAKKAAKKPAKKAVKKAAKKTKR